MSKQACAPLKLIFLFLFAVLAFSPAVVSSQEIIVLRIIVNAVDLGDSFVVLTPEGDVWVEREVLTRARLRDGVGSTATFEDKRYVSLSSVPGLEFNLTAPTIRGAVSKTVRAPKGARRARVTYAVAAEDDRNGRVPVSCTPKSGARFKIGRTKVNCSATDGDGNRQTATFVVRVLKTR